MAVRRRVGLVYDERMCAHAHPHDRSHPEKPDRIVAIAQRLKDAGVFDRCIHVEAREANDDELSTVHTKAHISLMKRISSKEFGKRGREKLARHFNSIYFNKGSSQSALLAAGSVVELCVAVAKGQLEAGAAIVRPPGHHAEAGSPMGFCLFNNVAIAAQTLVHVKQDLGIRKVLIVDWDVHHGNGTQNMFWDDDQVLYFSVHRYDNGSFYPMGTEGNYDKIGGDRAGGFNINVPWPHGGFGDSDYLTVWDHVLLPIAKVFNPDMIIISGGFDSAEGDPLGGCCLTPFGYSEMTRKLMDVAEGRVVLVLEGGYNLNSIANSYLACLHVLLGDSYPGNYVIPKTKSLRSTWILLRKVRKVLQEFWPVLHHKLSSSFQKEMDEIMSDILIEETLASVTLSTGESYNDSMDADSKCSEDLNHILVFEAGSSGAYQYCNLKTEEQELLDGLIEQVSTLAINTQSISEKLETGDLTIESSEQEDDQITKLCENNADNFSVSDLLAENKTSITERGSTCEEQMYVWYASYGSNMWKDRFMCYLQGGQVESLKVRCLGSRNKTPPKDTCWMVVGNQMFFGHSYTSAWGHGGVSFLEAKPTHGVSTHIRLYKIRLDQFNDLFLQENHILDYNSELIKPSFVQILGREPTLTNSITLVKEGWYGTILYLGDRDALPILTFTCSQEDLEKFKSGLLPMCAPSEAYQGAVVKGLMEDLGFSKERALSYVSSKVK